MVFMLGVDAGMQDTGDILPPSRPGMTLRIPPSTSSPPLPHPMDRSDTSVSRWRAPLVSFSYVIPILQSETCHLFSITDHCLIPDLLYDFMLTQPRIFHDFKKESTYEMMSACVSLQLVTPDKL